MNHVDFFISNLFLIKLNIAATLFSNLKITPFSRLANIFLLADSIIRHIIEVSIARERLIKHQYHFSENICKSITYSEINNLIVLSNKYIETAPLEIAFIKLEVILTFKNKRKIQNDSIKINTEQSRANGLRAPPPLINDIAIFKRTLTL